jgi:hypothetical protein
MSRDDRCSRLAGYRQGGYRHQSSNNCPIRRPRYWDLFGRVRAPIISSDKSSQLLRIAAFRVSVGQILCCLALLTNVPCSLATIGVDVAIVSVAIPRSASCVCLASLPIDCVNMIRLVICKVMKYTCPNSQWLGSTSLGLRRVCNNCLIGTCRCYHLGKGAIREPITGTGESLQRPPLADRTFSFSAHAGRCEDTHEYSC